MTGIEIFQLKIKSSGNKNMAEDWKPFCSLW